MKKIVFLALPLLALPTVLQAQDDMYFVPTKANVEKSMAEYGMPRDTYYSGSRRAVDDYNRQGSFVQSIDSVGNDIISFDGAMGVYPDSTGMADDYKYTRRMSRFDDYDWTDSYLAGYADGRFDSWGWSSPWYWDHPYYYGHGSWYWDYPYYYSYWGWGRPWYCGGWHVPYYSYAHIGHAPIRSNGTHRISPNDFRNTRGNSAVAARRSYGSLGTQRGSISQGSFSNGRSAASRQQSFGAARSSGTFSRSNNNAPARQQQSFSGARSSGSFSGGSGSFGGARSSGSFSGGGGSFSGARSSGSFGGRR